MQLEQSPPKDDLQNILNSLKIKSIEEFLSSEQHNIESLAKTTNNHKLVVQEYMSIIQKHITKPYTSLPEVTIPLDCIFARWGSSEANKEVKQSINSTSIVEIVGRANGGKSFLLNEIIVECLIKKQKIIYLDSNENLQKLSLRIAYELNQNQELKEEEIWFKHFEFKNLCELSMLLHCIGNELYHTKEPYFIFIDCLSRFQQPQNQNNQAASSMEFKFVDKIKRLFVKLNQHVGGIVYTTRCSNSNVLFNQVYKSERQRPKWIGSTTKQWDCIADKTFCIDYTRTEDDQQYWKVISAKAINNKLATLTRKCQ